MQKQTIALFIGALTLLTAGGVLVPQLLEDDVAPPMQWSPQEEVEVTVDAAAEPEGGDADAVQRIAMESADGATSTNDEARVEVVLRGRVIDKFQAPVAGARVWLDFGRAGQRGGPAARQRRVPAPVETDAEGRFAFAGQTFRQLRVSLQVLHARHAPGLFEKDIGEVRGEVELGDFVLNNGGEIAGRVTDLDGNGIAGAQLQLQPENGNRLRFVRDREQVLVAFTTDNNGYYRRPAVAGGDWAVTAVAKNHTEGRSPVFAVEEAQAVELEDIRLGPGYEVTGYVRTGQGQPIAKAEVTLRSAGRAGGGRNEGGGPGGPRAMGREHRATTDEQGRFFMEHLPGAPMRLDVRAAGYLDHTQEQVDPTLGHPLQIALQDGLKITGRALDEDGTPVTSFAVRAVRLRGLLPPGQTQANLAEMMTRLRSGDTDPATRAQLRAQFEGMRASMEPSQRRGRDEAEGRSPGRMQDHPGGEFALTGLQEGVYEVDLQSNDHARYRSAEIEVRAGLAVPEVQVKLDRGVYVAGIVTDANSLPIAGARVTLRSGTETEGGRRRTRGNNDAGPASVPDFEVIGREWARAMAGAQQNLEATTNKDGEFVLKHVSRGTWRANADADGFANATTEPFDLQTDRSDLVLRLGSLGTLTGQVRGLTGTEHTEARVAAVRVPANGVPQFFARGRGGSPFQDVGVAADGTYRIESLEPGEYVVRGWIGSPQDLMREVGPQMMGGTLAADVVIRGGETARFDVAVHRPQVGIVAGSVLHNGVPGAGLQVEVTLQDGASPGAERGPRGEGPGGRGMFAGGFGGTFRATVASSGRFQIEKVPAGNYLLRVQAGRRGGALHEQSVQVFSNTTAECNVVLTTQEVRGRVTRDDGGDVAELDGRASLLPGLDAAPQDLAAWQRDNPGFDARVQDGTFRFESLKPGQYLLVVTIRGRERTVKPVFVAAGDTQEITIAAGAISSAQAGPQPGARPGGAIPR